jgi:diguanylate cyclase (GGDEF)-like protein
MLRFALLRRHLFSAPVTKNLWMARTGHGNTDTAPTPFRQLERRQLALMTEHIGASGVPAYTVMLIALALAATLAAPVWMVILLVGKVIVQMQTMGAARRLEADLAAGQLGQATVRRLIGLCFVSALTWAMLTWPLEVGTELDLATFMILTIALFSVCLTVIAAAHHAAGLNAATAGGFLGLLPKVSAATPEVGPVLLVALPVLMATMWSYGLMLHRQSRGGIVLHMRVRSFSQRLEKTNAVLEETLRTAQRLADHDTLTGLRNRRAFERDLAAFQAQFAHRQLALMLLDIDHFKRINDRFGHETGDGVLLAIGTSLHHWAEESTGRMVGRWGGEEFIVVIALRPGQDLHGQLEELRLTVELLSDQLHWPDRIDLTTSIGCAPLTEAATLVGALREADQALYAAKDAGRNCWKVAA